MMEMNTPGMYRAHMDAVEIYILKYIKMNDLLYLKSVIYNYK